MKYKAILFDCDGTLLNTITDLTNAVNFSLQSVGLPKQTEEDTLKMVGKGIKVLVEKALGEENNSLFPKAFSAFSSYYNEHYCDYTTPYAGISETLKTLKDNGYKLFVISNKKSVFLKKLYHLYFADTIVFALGETEGLRPKPEPDMVEYVLNTYALRKEEVVYVGDSRVDIETATRAGIDGIFVTWGFDDKDTLLKNGAKILIDAPRQLVGFV